MKSAMGIYGNSYGRCDRTSCENNSINENAIYTNGSLQHSQASNSSYYTPMEMNHRLFKKKPLNIIPVQLLYCILFWWWSKNG